MGNLILNEISAAVKSQLDQQEALGVRIVQQGDVPDTGPVRGGAWVQIPEATAVFVDLKGSTGLNARFGAEAAAHAHAYNCFNRAMAVTLDGFRAKYVAVQGYGLFRLFHRSVQLAGDLCGRQLLVYGAYHGSHTGPSTSSGGRTWEVG